MTSMTPERWQRMKGVLYEALELPTEKRGEYLDRACSGEDSLRREVDSMLSSGDQSCSNFLQSSAPRVPLPAGTKLEHYEVISLVGAGGMGEVYRAHDPRLGRDVAIKVLPSVFSNDPDRLRRFEQEARAAAALNHPNIVAIHDVGTTKDGIPYVVSELLEGETLRQCLRRGPLPSRKAVDLALQMAKGLAAAHDKGIIHRDLKPENLFLTKDGHLKILDFGLAKLVNSEAASPNTRTLTRDTTAGMMMGTVGYMPPEQVRGLAIDQRADIFAAGAVVYEMLSGKRAFQGETTADTIDAILNRDPRPLTETNPTVSPAFERMVQRCLEKNPDERFHSVRDVAFALEAISDLPGSHASGQTTVPEKARPPARRRYLYAGVLVALVLSLGAGVLYYRAKMRLSAPQEWEPLTNFPDSVVAPALSPDGRMLTFVRSTNTFVGRGDVYLKLLPQGEPVQLTHDDNMKTTPAFSPDGSRIAYSVAPAWDTWAVPVLGGRPQSMLPNASGLTWVDDRHLLFSEIKSGIHMAVVTATEGRADERDVYVPSQQTAMAHRSYLSPNHKWVLIATEMDNTGDKPCRLVPFDGGSPGRIVGPPNSLCTYAAWSKDGDWMFFSALNSGGGFHLWRQGFPDGEPEQFTFGPTEQEGIAIMPDGRSLLSSVGQASGIVLVRDKSGEQQVPFEGQARLTGARTVFSPDGAKIYFLGRRSLTEPEELWVGDLASGLVERVAPGLWTGNSYAVSPDGKQIVVDSSDAPGESHLWVVSLDRRQPPRRLESTFPDTNPVFGPAGDLFFQRGEGDSTYLYRRNLDSGETRKVIPTPISIFHTISPDGKWVVAQVAVTGEDRKRAVVAYRLGDGASKRVCNNLCELSWTLDGKFFYIGLFGPGNSDSDFKTFVIPLRLGEMFPDLPATGIKSESDVAQLRGVQVIPELVYPGPNGSRYAVSRWAVHRNIYRIPIP
jgi:serine/threonine protein kinase/Tol biopolymer transport system component